MNPIIVDAEDRSIEYWTVAQCAEYCGIARNTFSTYVGRCQAPQPVGRFAKTPLWRAEEIKRWHAGRPGRGNWS